MKQVAFILLLLPGFAWAQADTLRVKPDTLLSKATAQIDSVQHSFMVKSDSIKQTYAEQKQKIMLLKERYLSRIDSLKRKRSDARINPMDTLTNAVDRSRFSRKIESLRNRQPANPLDTLPADVAHYTHKIDSLDRQLESVQHQTTERLDSLKERSSEQAA